MMNTGMHVVTEAEADALARRDKATELTARLLSGKRVRQSECGGAA